MRILIFGAGVIGSLYAALLSEVGIDVSVYARGNRLQQLREYGLLYKKKEEIKSANISVLDTLKENDRYDFILLTVREEQLMDALSNLRNNISPTIVTMVNSLDTYDKWESVCGKGRILPAFPGAGGGFDGNVLVAGLTPRIIQPTTVGKIGGRERELKSVFKQAGIPCQVVEDMHTWQICHLGMVVPIADAYYESNDPEHAGNDREIMNKTAFRIKKNFQVLAAGGIRISPPKMNIFRITPIPIISMILGLVFRSDFGNTFMYQHSIKAPGEMRRLHDQFYTFINE